VKGYNAVASFASGYESARFIRQLPDGDIVTTLLQDVVHLLGSFNRISQSQIKDTDVKVNPVNHYRLNLYNGHDKLFATAPQGDAHIFLD
jgi:hypothetical protein